MGPYRLRPPWTTPDTSGAIREECDLFQYWSYHPLGANFLYVDGSVHFLTYPADHILPRLATRAGGEVTPLR